MALIFLLSLALLALLAVCTYELNSTSLEV
uniref:Uncharacterized protein n=1 Tax=Arundo donax TaxID=35708 RepID=A0A0A9FTZ7_ARUDO